MDANGLKQRAIESLKTIDVKKLTICDVIEIKTLIGLTDSEAIDIFLGA